MGAPADLVLIAPELAWKPEPGDFRSRSKNTPFLRRELVGRVAATYVGGERVYALDSGEDS